MSSTGKVFMYLFLLILAGLLLHNAAGSVGILLAGGSELKAETNALEGSSKPASKGRFSVGGTKIALG